MVLIGSLRLIVGLTFLGVVIALCIWLLSRLFPGTSNTSHISPDSTAPATFQVHHISAAGEHRRRRVSEIGQEQGPQNDADERKP
jgi:hypothetical protein